MRGRWFHRLVWRFLWIFAAPLVKLLFRYRCIQAESRFSGTGKAVIVIANHNTDLDPAFVGCSFPGQLYFVASEHVLRMGFISSLIRLFFAPVVFSKGMTDTRGVRDLLRRLKEGSNVCFFAEGNRSFSGLTGPFKEATGKLVKLSGAALITYRLRGGYFAAPRWSRKMRKGPVWGRPVGYYSPEELKAMKVQEINELIRRDISEDAYAVMEQDPHPYTGRNLAEDLETALYLCPVCVQTGTLSSKGNTLYCTCGFRTEYDQYGAFHGTVPEGRRPAADPFATVRDWWLWQEAAMEGIALSAGDGPVCSDEDQELYEIRSASRAELAARGRLTLGTGGLCCGPVRFSLRDIGELAITGQRTITFAAGKKQYELKSRFPRSAAKYKRVFEVLTKKIPSAETSAGAQRED